MLQTLIKPFIGYCRLTDFSDRSIQSFEVRLREFRFFLIESKIGAIADVEYLHLVEFTAKYRNPSIHVTKFRVWAMRQFYHFLALNGHADNIAGGLSYPKIEKTVPQFLNQAQYDRLLEEFTAKAVDLRGLRNLAAFLLLSVFGLRTASLLAIDCGDIHLTSGLIWLKTKGRLQRSLVLPAALCRVLEHYLSQREPPQGPLLITRRARRLSARSLQDILRKAAVRVGIDQTISPRLFRHSAATHLNRVAGIEITQQVLGHRRRANTVKYTHLNPDVYVDYMQRHPYMTPERRLS